LIQLGRRQCVLCSEGGTGQDVARSCGGKDTFINARAWHLIRLLSVVLSSDENLSVEHRNGGDG
jgi:hypothetical protein